MILKVTAEFAIDVVDGQDEQAVAAQFDSGLIDAVAHFPGGEVFHAQVESVTQATPEEIAEQGWEVVE